jgi:cell division protein FtsQ
VGLRKHKNRRKADPRQKIAAVNGLLASCGRALLWWSLVCGSLAALAIGGYRINLWVHHSPRFALNAVSFQGLHHASQADLLRLAGLSVGQNLFQLESGSIERAMAAHPWVDQVRVARRFPRSLAVSVKEHHPVALVALGDLYLVDSEGRPFKKIQSGDPTELPLITGLPRELFVEAPEQSRIRLREMLDWADAYTRADSGHASPLNEIRIGRTGVVLVTAQGQEIWISEGDPKEGLSRLKRVRAELEKRGLTAQVIHLENRSRPAWVAVKLANAVAAKRGGPAR